MTAKNVGWSTYNSMARSRENIECPFCGEVIARPVYWEPAPWQPPMAGDHFSHYKWEEHDCPNPIKIPDHLRIDPDKLGIKKAPDRG